MARSKKLSRVRRKGFVQRNEHFWTSVIEDEAVIGSGVLRFSGIVAPTDWVTRAGYTTANLVRIRGHWDVRTHNVGTPGTAGGNSVVYAIIVVDADDAVNFNPKTLASLNENRVLWTRCKNIFQFGAAANGNEACGDNFEIDVKAQAKLRPDDFVYMVTYNDGSLIGGDNSLLISGILRALVVVK